MKCNKKYLLLTKQLVYGSLARVYRPKCKFQVESVTPHSYFGDSDPLRVIHVLRKKLHDDSVIDFFLPPDFLNNIEKLKNSFNLVA